MVWFPGFVLLLQELLLTQGSPAAQVIDEAVHHALRKGLNTDEYDSIFIANILEVSDGKTTQFDHNGIKHRRDVEDKTILHIPIEDGKYILHLSHQKSVLHPEAPIILTEGDSKQTVDVSKPNCYLVGSEQSHGGTASFSYCNGLRGTFVTNHTQVVVLPIEDTQRHLVATRTLLEKEQDLLRTKKDGHVDTSGKVVIEIGVYIDAAFYKFMEKLGEDTLVKKMDYILVKWNAVQYEYSNKEVLGRVVEIQLKKMEFFKTNPDWLVVSNKLGTFLKSLCDWNIDKEPFDNIYLHTGHSPTDYKGLAYGNGTCTKNKRCATSSDREWGRYAVVAHELGHNLGMSHDANTSCGKYPKENRGLMGGHGTNFTHCSAAAFRRKIEGEFGKCLFVQNIKIVQADLDGVKLNGLLPQMYKTFDDMCTHRMGTGYRYREYTIMRKYSCSGRHFCVNMNPGEGYGYMVYVRFKPLGQYCEDGKACFKQRCTRIKDLKLHVPLPVRQGQWGPWGPYSECSRSCGTGVSVSQRQCNSPSPMNAKDCKGEEFRANLCNTTRCYSEPKLERRIILLRANEVCYNLIKSGLLNTTEYYPYGRVYRTGDPLYSCEVHCNLRKKAGSYRTALMPDGTFCNSPSPRYRIPQGVYKRTKYRCFKGICRTFGCTDDFPPESNSKVESCQRYG